MVNEMSVNQNIIIRICGVVVAAFISALNINTFVNAGGLFPGGLNGVTVFIQRISSSFFGVELPFTPINLILNIIPIYIGIKMIGKKFTLLSCLMIFSVGIFVDILPTISLTKDILLIALFGGLMHGFAISIALKVKASGGGTDFIALALAEKKNVPTWNYVLAMNGGLLLAAGYLFGWDKSLYSIIFQICSTLVINTLHTRNKQMTAFIITDKPEVIGDELMKLTHHGVTRFDGVGCYTDTPKTLLYVVVNTSQIYLLREIVKKLDTHSFINIVKTGQIDGNFYQQPLD